MTAKPAQYIVGVDIGGTFTAAVVLSENVEITIGKALSTPDDFSLGAIDAVSDAARHLGREDEDVLLRSTRLFFHACTVGENTVITRAGAKTGVITTKGFADTLLIIISVKAAREVYGVVLDESEEAVDLTATTSLRASLKKAAT